MRTRGFGELEDEYRRSTLREDAGHVKILAAILAAFSLIYAFVDLRLFGLSKTLVLLYLVRTIMVVLSLDVFFFIGRIKAPRTLDRLIFAWTIISLSGFLFIDFTRPATFPFHVSLDIVSILVVYLVIPGRHVFRYIAAGLFSAGVAAWFLFVRKGVDPVGIYSFLFSLLAANLIGFLISMRLNKYRGLQFMARHELQSVVREKEGLLQEVHHRVKNNLQIMSSLMALQTDSITDARALELFRESQERIRSIALIHEKLYRADDLARLDFGEFLADLGGTLSGLSGPGRAIEVWTEASGVRLGLEVATPCALIVNELVTNALKHAFAGRDKGTVSVSLESSDTAVERRFRLRVADDGVGLEPGFDWRAADSMGLRLVDMLTKQLKGTMDVATGRDKGTSFTIEFARPFAGAAG